MLLDTGRRKIVKSDGEPIYLTVIDELAYYSATVGTKAEREKFNNSLRDCVARGRKCARRYVVATQRPSSDIVPTSLRDLFGYRWAFRCATDDSSDVVLGKGAAKSGHTAAAIPDQARGVGLLRAEGKRVPRRVKAAYLTDDELRRIAAHAAILRGRS
jgi:S-DNA-T family DNA segregation ATPase FtsK/SpoIIIE